MSFRDLAFSVAFPCLGLVLACSGPVESSGTGGEDLVGGNCNAVSTTVSGLKQNHIDVCSAVDYPDNPPAGGKHYSVWAAFESYPFAVPRGFWVHDLEHGAVVYSYNCAPDCPDEVATVQALIDALPSDPSCSGDPARRVVLTPDPLLDVRWGLSAWGHTLRADCVDAQRFTQFYRNHFGLGPEQVCAQGSDFGGVAPCQTQ